MELTYEAYKLLGGICPESLFDRCKLEAESALAQIESIYAVMWNTDEAKAIALIALIDDAYNSDQTMQGGGQVTTISVGSYSETRKNGSSSGAFDFFGRTKEILGRYARLYRKPVGVVR